MNSTSPATVKQRRVLFHRDFRAFSGGHLKVWDYFQHVAALPNWTARIAFSAESKWDASNPWIQSREAVGPWDPATADLLFLAGTDWRVLSPAQRQNPPTPIINLIQHPRHAEKGSELRSFLKHRAIRICVSEEVAQAIKATGEINGPVFVIPNGVDSSSLPAIKDPAKRTTDLLICGLKAPELARMAYSHFAGKNRNVRWLIEWMPRQDYLARLANAKITLFLPRPSEGFYLPALEGMGCGTLVICPDCVGNRSFCFDGLNSLRPAYESDAIVAATDKALGQTESERDALLAEAQATFRAHSLEQERAGFYKILDQLDEL
ncbi:MAG TPA: glycosyltransferase [Chthoniobacterales bacterium]